MDILLFGSFRETYGSNSISISLPDGVSVLELKNHINTLPGKFILPNNALCAINQEMAKDDEKINSSDEVAIYPPVTGG